MAFGGRIFGALLIVGGGALAVAAITVAPQILRAARPAAREALRRGIGLYERARGAAAEFAEDVEDLVAEVQSELKARKEFVPATTESKSG